MTVDEKFVATAQLMDFARDMGWFEQRGEEEAQVQEMWRRLTIHYAQKAKEL